MAYEGMTGGGNKVDARLYEEYQREVVRLQSNGMPAPTYDEWASQRAGEGVRELQDRASKYF
jgi:hypothetical protein